MGSESIPATPSTKHASCFPPSSLPASIEISIKLIVCLLLLLPCWLTVSRPLQCLKVLLIVPGQGTLISLRLWSIVPLLSRLLICGPSSLVLVPSLSSGIVSWIYSFAFLVWGCLQLCPLVDTLRRCSVPTDGK
jgi:hypothetical protein